MGIRLATTTTSAPLAVPLMTSDPPTADAWTWPASSAVNAFELAMYCRSTSSPFLAKMPASRATHSDKLSAIRLLYAMPIFLAGPAVGVGTTVWAAGAHAATTMLRPIRMATNDRGIAPTGYKFCHGMRVAPQGCLEVRRASFPENSRSARVAASPSFGTDQLRTAARI